VSGGAGDGAAGAPRVRRRALVSGRVQGVFFRDSARQEASRRGVAGLARNLPDGRVEVVLEGPPDAVDAVLSWLRRGPAYARVDTVEVTEGQPAGLHGFEIA
jgi:acylphosphatase